VALADRAWDNAKGRSQERPFVFAEWQVSQLVAPVINCLAQPLPTLLLFRIMDDRRAGRAGMLKIRHIALASQHPGKAAEFYKIAFGWREVSRMGKDMSDPAGVVLSDGSINVAILRFATD